MIARVTGAVTGPRGRWITIAIWTGLASAGFVAHARIGDVTAAGQSSYLPASAQSTRVVEALQRDFKGAMTFRSWSCSIGWEGSPTPAPA